MGPLKLKCVPLIFQSFQLGLLGLQRSEDALFLFSATLETFE